MEELFNINLDIFIRTLFLTFSFLWVTYLGAKLGEDYLAVNTILMQFIILAAFFLDAYAFSTEGVVGFSVGRKNKSKIRFLMDGLKGLIILSIIVIPFLHYKRWIDMNSIYNEIIHN